MVTQTAFIAYWKTMYHLKIFECKSYLYNKVYFPGLSIYSTRYKEKCHQNSNI